MADSGNDRIQVFDENGNFVSTYGEPGIGEGEFNDPQGLALDADGNVLVVDSANDRVRVLSFDGTGLDFVRALIADFDKPTGVATYGGGYIIVADTGNILVADTGNKRVVSILEALPAWKVYMPMVRIDE